MGFENPSPPSLLLGTDIHAQCTPAEVEQTLRLIGDELRGDLEQAAAGFDEDAGFAQDGELLGDHVPERFSNG